jgi:hypothetical protein
LAEIKAISMPAKKAENKILPIMTKEGLSMYACKGNENCSII